MTHAAIAVMLAQALAFEDNAESLVKTEKDPQAAVVLAIARRLRGEVEVLLAKVEARR